MKEKRYSISVLGNKNVIQVKDTDFYTTDTDAWLIFKLSDNGLNPEKATITLINSNDKSVVSESIEVEDNTVKYHMRSEIISHGGQWKLQLIFDEDINDYTSAIINFKVHGHIMDNKEPALEIIDNWNTFMQQAEDFMIDMDDQLHELPTYARRIGDLEEENESLSTQLAQKVGGGKKAELEDLSGEVLSAIEGGEGTSFELLSVPQDDSVTDDKLADGITLEKVKYVTKKTLRNLLNPEEVVSGGYYHINYGTWVNQPGYKFSGLIPVEYGKEYWKTDNGHVTYWDNDGHFISGSNSSKVFTVPNNPSVRYVGFSMLDNNTPFHEWMMVKGSTAPSTFEPYHEFYEFDNDRYVLDDSVLSDDKKQTLNKLSDDDVSKIRSINFKRINLLNPDEVEKNGSYRMSDGIWNYSPSDTRRSTGLIEVEEGKTYVTPRRANIVTYWDENDDFIFGNSPSQIFTIPRGLSIKYMRIEMVEQEGISYDDWMVVEGRELPNEFIPYDIGKVKEIEDLDIQMESALSTSPNSVGYIEAVAGGETQLTHPSLVYFEEGWNGYKFWMGITPYPNSNSRLENPCILASNDLVNWDEPADNVNPLDVPPSDNPYFNSDTELFVKDNTLELWWRRRYSSTSEQFIRRTSTDGVNWTPEEVVFESESGSDILSPSVYYENGMYKMWTLNGNNGEFSYWEGERPEDFALIRKFTVGEGDAWHAQVKKTGSGEYEMYFSHGIRSQNYYISHSKSTDNINWSEPEVVIRSVPLRYDSQLYRPSFVDIPGKLRTNTLRVIAYGMYHENNIWNTGISIAYKEAPTHARGLNLLEGKVSKLPKELRDI